MRLLRIILLPAFLLPLVACESRPPICPPKYRQPDGSCKLPTFTPPTSPPPTTKPPPTRPPTTKPPSPTPTTPREARSLDLVIRSLGGGFDPEVPRACPGMVIRFRNLDRDNEHAWRAEDGQWKSPTLKYGDPPWEYTVRLAPGRYDFVDLYPYIRGTLEVLSPNAPEC